MATLSIQDGAAIRFLLGAAWAAIAIPLWLAAYLALLGLNGFFAWAPPGAPLHALTVGAIGTMTLAVMTRAPLGHTGQMAEVSALAGRAWSGAFGLFAILYAPLLLRPK